MTNPPPAARERGPGLGERLADAALATLLSVLSVRLAFAIAARNEEWAGTGVAYSAGAGVSAAVILGLWLLIVAPMLGGLAYRPLRRRSGARRAVGLALVSLLNAALPALYVILTHTVLNGAPEPLRDGAWALLALALVTPAIGVFAGAVLSRKRVTRLIVLLAALASVIHLAFWLDSIQS